MQCISTKSTKHHTKSPNEVCGVKKGMRDKGNTGWWNEDVKEAIATKKDAFKEMRKNGTEENKVRYKRLKKASKESGCEGYEGGV